MLDRMIESKTDAPEKFRRGNFLLATLFAVALTLSGAMLYSLYAKPLGTMGEDLELSSIVAPIAAAEPSAAEPPEQQLESVVNTKTATETIRVVNQKAIDESPDVPKEISNVKNQYASRPPAPFKIGAIDSEIASSNSGSSREGSASNIGISANPKQTIINAEDEKEPPKMMPKSSPPQMPKITRQTLGVVNGIARDLPKPVYPPAARAIHASGAVNVQVTINEQGRVVSANAVSGHPLLRPAAEQAARKAVFSPTTLSKIPVQVSGVIVYNFVAQ